MAKNSLIRKSGRHGHPTSTPMIFLWGYLKQRVYNPLPKNFKGSRIELPEVNSGESIEI